MSYEFYDSVATSSLNVNTSRLRVKLTADRSSWVSLPPSLGNALQDAGQSLPLLLRLSREAPSDWLPAARADGASEPVMAWAGAVCAPGELGVPACVAAALDLCAGEQVRVLPAPEVPAAEWVSVEPASADDWEVLELNAEHLEQHLLAQGGAVLRGAPLCCWVRSQLLTLSVAGLHPNVPAARLVPGTEIHVAPRLRAAQAGKALVGARAGDAKPKDDDVRRFPGSLAPASLGPPGGASLDARPPPFDRPSSAGPGAAGHAPTPAPAGARAFRIQPVTAAQEASALEALGGSGAFSEVALVHPSTLRGLPGAESLQGCWALPVAASEARSSQARPMPVPRRLVPCARVAPGHVGLTPAGCRSWGVSPRARARLALTTLAGAREKNDKSPLEDAGQASLDALRVSASLASSRAGTPRSPFFTPRCSQALPGAWEESAPRAPIPGWLAEPARQLLSGLLPLLARGPRARLARWAAPRAAGCLLSGPAGSGKSALAASLAELLQAHPDCLAHAVVLDCRRELSPAALARALAEALAKAPALLVLEDLDVIAPRPGGSDPGAPPSPAAAAVEGLVDELAGFMDALCRPRGEWGVCVAGGSEAKREEGKAAEEGEAAEEAKADCAMDANAGASATSASSFSSAPSLHCVRTIRQWAPVAVLATARSPAALHPSLLRAGRLAPLATLPAPSAATRAGMLAARLETLQRGSRSGASKRIGFLDAGGERGSAAAPSSRPAAFEPGAQQALLRVAARAEGFDAADLSTVVDRALQLALARQLRGGEGAGAPGARSQLLAVIDATPLEERDLARALEGFTPAAFWDVGAPRALAGAVRGWEDVGGLPEVRAALHEALELPLRHAARLARAPLRLRTGALLYGPPGCGKTHAVAAAVAAAGVRCISVSGPELLNKYIGASEENVRAVFARAAAAAPSVLFFDEFDAIAPRRGHDNTGVTDRVVNQLLTELDGVQGLKGVCVLAATSRPDLIDPALLRPGRLDRLLLCDFPTPSQRADVLQVLSRNLRLAPDVDLPALARDAHHCTGADLASLLAEAQLAAAHQALALGEGGRDGGGSGTAPSPSERKTQATRLLEAPPISQAHLREALAGAQPSVPEAERFRLAEIYRQFQTDRAGEGGGEAARRAAAKGKKQTLA